MYSIPVGIWLKDILHHLFYKDTKCRQPHNSVVKDSVRFNVLGFAAIVEFTKELTDITWQSRNTH